MTRKEEILNELKKISLVLSQISTVMPYSIPPGYFDSLDSVILARIAAGGHEEHSLLQVAGKEMPQNVPHGYFESLAGNILSKIKQGSSQSVAEELKELSPLLVDIGNDNLYNVPAGYFETLPETITRQLPHAEETKVISIFSRKIWLRFAAAAAVFALIAFGLQFFVQPKTVTAIAARIKTEDQFNKELSKVSDDAIIRYLKLTADSKDAEVMASLIDESQLPSTAEYMDDAFLESFMKELEKTDQQTKQTN